MFQPVDTTLNSDSVHYSFGFRSELTVSNTFNLISLIISLLLNRRISPQPHFHHSPGTECTYVDNTQHVLLLCTRASTLDEATFHEPHFAVNKTTTVSCELCTDDWALSLTIKFVCNWLTKLRHPSIVMYCSISWTTVQCTPARS